MSTDLYPNVKRNGILVTTGDPDGIGLEVFLKAYPLVKHTLLGPTIVFVIQSAAIESNYLANQLDFLNAPRCLTLNTAVQLTDNGEPLVIYTSNSHPESWVEEAAEFCLDSNWALVTGPLSKSQKNLGHTDILKKVTKCDDLYMTFLGEHFHVGLGTDHIPLKNVASHWTEANLTRFIDAMLRLKNRLNLQKHLTLLGLNPHAGESGLIGDEELFWKSTLSRYNDSVIGPVPADSAFQHNLVSQTSLFLALYHDQGLIPFKTLHQQRGVQLSWGLPFIRTSVDHGTAKAIYGKNVANPQSMVSAMDWANKLLSGRAI